MSAICDRSNGRRWFSTAVFVFCIPLLASLLATLSPPEASAADDMATLTIVKETDPDSGTGFPFSLLSNGPSLIWGGQGSGDGQFLNQSGVAIDSAGNIFVADRSNHRIQKFDSNGNFLLKWGSYGSGDGQLNYPTDVALDASGNAYVTDQYNHRIQKFDSSGNFVLKWGVPGSGDGQFRSPSNLAIDNDSTIYISEYLGNRIQKFDSSGAFVGKWGVPGSGDGQFNHPAGVAIDGAGNIYVSDIDNHRVQKFEKDGNFLLKWGSYGTGDGQFNRAVGVALDAVGNVFVTDWSNNRVQKFTNSGVFLRKWGSYGSAPGQFNYPGDVIVGGDGAVYVSDQNGCRIQKFVDAAVSLNDDGSKSYVLNPASYVVSEVVPDEWLTPNISCDGDLSLSGSSVTLMLAMGDDVTCIFTNTLRNQPPTLNTDNDPVSVNEGAGAANSGTVNDPNEDQVTLTASVGTVSNNGDGTWSWSFPTSDGPAESQTMNIYADDGEGGTVQTSFTLNVINVAPTIDAISVPLEPVNIGAQPVSASATFSDPAGTHDEPYTCTVDYGDGTDPQAGNSSGSTCGVPDHTYEEPGVYLVTVLVNDKDGGSHSAQATDLIVIYDPTGGFATGGGWILSPKGACPRCPISPEGKASFGFVSKYKKGASVPSGSTNFQFKAGDLHFKSSNYEWLVIAGANAKYKGEGTINGEGAYKFMLTATDGDLPGGGDVDKFRIRIWDDKGLYYDNNANLDEDEDGGTELGGGNVKIHKAKK